MEGHENTLLILLIILTLGLLIPEMLRKFRMPLISMIILAGAIFGPNGFDYVQNSETIDFFGFLGMTFLMFMAGLETDISKLKNKYSKIITMAVLNGFIPFIVGFGITVLFGESWEVGILVGTIFVSSSVAVIITTLSNNKTADREQLQLIMSSIFVIDIISLILLGIILQNNSPVTSLSLPVYYVVLFFSLPALFFIIPLVSRYLLKRRFVKDKGYERQLRFIMIILIGVVTYLLVLGVHPILGAFLAGLALSGIIHHSLKDTEEILIGKLHTLGYGIFIPVFFFIVGMELDYSVLLQFNITNLLMVSLVISLIVSKFLSGFIAGKIVKLSNKYALVFGSISITQLTTTLAVAYTGSALGILPSEITTAIIIIAVITTFIGPSLATYFLNKKNI